MDDIEVHQDEGYHHMDADAGVDGTVGGDLPGLPSEAAFDGPAPVHQHAAPEPATGYASMFSRMFNPEKRKVAFEDAAAGSDADNGEDGEDDHGGGGGSDEGDAHGGEHDDDEDADDAEDVKKAWYLRQMKKLHGPTQAGFGSGIPIRPMTMRHSLRDIKAEFHKMCADLDEEEGERNMKMMLSFAVHGSERANWFFGGPLMLNGWGGYFNDELNTGRHDRIIAQLQAKYSKYTSWGPEMQLAKALGTSAMSFHLAQKYGDTVSAWMQDGEFLEAVDRTRAQMRQSRGQPPPEQSFRSQMPGAAQASPMQQPPVMRQQPMSRPGSEYVFSSAGTIVPSPGISIGINTRPHRNVQAPPVTRVQEMMAAPPSPRSPAASDPNSHHSDRCRSPAPSAASSDSGIKPMTSEPSQQTGRSGRQSNATSGGGRGRRGGKRVLQL